MECFNACPNSAHVLIGEKHKIIREQCSNCGTCTNICPGGALIMIGEEKSHREIIKEILLDYPYYKNSAGGITISGGEPLAQVNFTRAILKAAQKKHIHTAIESNLAFNWETVFRVVPYTDLIITDIKLFDTKKHKLHTNSFNDSILRNIKNLSNIGKDMIIRTPIIPGINNSISEISKIAQFISKLNHIKYYEILPFNSIGMQKYEYLGRDNAFGNQTIPLQELEELASTAEQYGIQVKLAI